MTKKHRLFQFTAARIIYLFGIIVFPFLMTHVLEPSNYSKFVFFSTLIATTLEIINLGIPSGIKRSLLEKNQDVVNLRKSILNLIMKFLVSAFIITGFIFIIWFTLFGNTFDGKILFMIIVWLSAVFGVGTLFLSNYVYGTERFGWYALQEVSFSFIRLIVIPLAAKYGGLEWALLGLLIVQIVIFAINILGINLKELKDGIGDFRSLPIGQFKKFIGYSGKWYLCNFCEQGYRFSAIFILAALTSKSNSEVGFLHLSFFSVSAVSMIFTALLNAYFPALSYFHDNGDISNFNRLTFTLKKYLIMISGTVVLFTWGFMDDVVKLLPSEYFGISKWIKLMIVISYFRAISNTLSFQSLAGFKMNEYLKANFVWMIVYVIFFTVGGLLGKGWGILLGAVVSEVVYMIIFTHFADRKIYLGFPILIIIFALVSYFPSKLLTFSSIYLKLICIPFVFIFIIVGLFLIGIIQSEELRFLAKTSSMKKDDE